MIHSIRGRLAAWYAAVFALFLALFALAAYWFLATSSRARIDEYLAETASAVADAMLFERSLGVPDSAAVASVVREFRLRDIDVVVYERDIGKARNARNSIVEGTTAARVTIAPLLRDPETFLRSAPPTPALRTVAGGRDPVRVYTLPYSLGSEALVIATVQSMHAQQRMLYEAELGLALGIPVMLLLATLGGFVLARKSLQPVVEMSARAEAIGAATLHERLPVFNPRDELGRLATVFNGLLQRVEQSFEQQRRFMADASHELRTPVAIISGESELALARDRDSADLREALGTIRDESRRLRGVVDDLFLLAQANAGERALKPEELYVRDLLEECIRAARSLAQAREITLTADLSSDDLPTIGDEALLKRLVMNLLDNAIKYTLPGGRVVVRSLASGVEYGIEIEDSGPGIPPDAQPRIFDRFFRAPPGDASVPRPSGAGLGLGIARWVARAHGGELSLARSDARGTVFRLTLPARKG